MSKNLLVIEDSKSIASVIERIGTSLNYNVTVAYSFAEVKHLLAKPHDFFLATVDYSLPDANNGEVIPFVLDHNIPSIVMTGHMDDITRKKILSLPVVDYITKENSQAYHYLLRVLRAQTTNADISVLVVDDSLTARNQVCNLLKRRNFNVYDVSDGHKALQLLNEHPEIKLVITDQEMPKMSGIELVQKIRRNISKDELIVIGISGANKSSQSARFIKNGADDFLRKPFCPEEFYCRIMQNIEKLKHLETISLAANKDYLTSLFNRRYFLDKVTHTYENQESILTTYVLALIAIDNFKDINENIGHKMADNILIELANLLNKHFKGDLTARFGGGEFSVLISGEDEKIIEEHLNEFRQVVAKNTLSTKEAEHNFTVSIGCTIMHDENTLKELLTEANRAIHEAIDGGGNCTVMNGFIELE